MYIKSIEIEGFKSYGKRTVINGFDPLFNAITGNNGTGKSNILDSICFVLGITNLSQLRANSLQELVYKSGQAGISKATVSITFDNSDPSSSPIGYEGQKELTITRSVVIGGKNKYLINGTTATNNRVQDFFQSVQLNVNNPHFLIMQGRITKVLNMKPQEILSMVEEAVGTRMYETKRENALKLMEKKDARLKEIDNLLDEHITPSLTRLKEERKEYYEYTKIASEMDHLKKLDTAWQYVEAQESSSRHTQQRENVNNRLDGQKKNLEDILKIIQEVESKIERQKENLHNQRSAHIEDLMSKCSKAEIEGNEIATQLNHLNNALKEENKKKNALMKEIDEDKASLSEKQKVVKEARKKAEELKLIWQAEHGFSSGNNRVSRKEKERKKHENKLREMEVSVTAADCEIKRLKAVIKKIQENIVIKQKEVKQMGNRFRDVQAKVQATEKEVKKIEEAIKKLGYEEGQHDDLQSQKMRLSAKINRLKENLDLNRSRFPHLTFNYKDPVKNFCRDFVYGPVCALFSIKDLKAGTALEVAAGGKLFNIVVEDEQVGKLLLNKGGLKQRYTMIPLNKISQRTIESAVVQNAENLVGKSNVSLALSLVECEIKVLPAMKFVFGGTFICTNMECSTKVTYHPKIKKKSVTLQGELFDPAGTLSGGSMKHRGKILAEIAGLQSMKKELNEKQILLKKITDEIPICAEREMSYQSLKAKHERMQEELQITKASISRATSYDDEVKNLQASLEENKLLLEECIRNKEASIKAISEMQKKLSDYENKKSNIDEEYRTFENTFKTLKIEFEIAQKSLSSNEEQLEKLTESIFELETTKKQLEEKVHSSKERSDSLNQEVLKCKASISSVEDDIENLNKKRNMLNKNMADADLKVKELTNELNQYDAHIAKCQKKVEDIRRKYDWIETDKRFFGVPNTEYDFQKFDAPKAAEKLAELGRRKERMSKNVNTKAQAMLVSVEEQYEDLIRKKRVVLTDKAHIESVIKDLDNQKKQSLTKACEKVNEDFSSIFRTLLPGADAKVVPKDGQTVLDGLEFKVAFGGTWKESLSELSGGQRSLVALSLILALLLFNPAPLYILDEVDAALDMSHTQNIGKMLKIHFKRSQFIVVSLKDGMFSNANVLFRTENRNGISSVNRTAHKPS